MSLSIIQAFIKKADHLGMPVNFLRVVMKKYDIKIKPGYGIDNVQPYLNNLNLYEGTITGLRRNGLVLISVPSVQTFYHEAAHAYVDIVDADRSGTFIHSESHYKGGRLTNNQLVNDPERVTHEAIGSYVGHRAASMFSVFNDIEIMNEICDKVDSKKLTISQAFDLKLGKHLKGPSKSIPERYEAAMRKVKFGYEEVNGEQVSIANRNIPYDLQKYCDEIILENKIKNRFSAMTTFHAPYNNLQLRWLSYKMQQLANPWGY